MGRLILILMVVIVFSGCDDKNELVAPAQAGIQLTVSNLPHLGHTEGYYQLWAVFLEFNKPGRGLRPLHDEGYVSLGKFNVSPDGQYLTGPDCGPPHLALPAGENPQLIDRVAITIQSHHDHDAVVHDDEPGAILLGGRMRGTERTGVADLAIEFDEAMGGNMRSVRGTYTIMAPTSDPADSTAGIWFIQQGTTMTASLQNLPTLNEEWRYEGWVVHQGPGTNPHYYSTGKFQRADSADADGAGSGKGPGAGLNFPGQDFITGTPSRPDLTSSDYWFMVTIEPVPDNSPDPFFVRLLSNEHLTFPRRAHATLPLDNIVRAHAPTARLILHR